MRASSLWQHRMRETTKNDPEFPFYGLLPRGMGDCGMMNGNDYFGFFYPWNCLAVWADALTAEAAGVLGLDEDVRLFRGIHEEAKRDLLRSIERNAIDEGEYKWIPCTAGQTGGSMFGALYAYYPCKLLPFSHPLIQGTLKRMEKNMSGGGLPKGLGWVTDGLWVAMALDNIGAMYLDAGMGDMSARFLYPTVNHASSLVTWCEERGAESGSSITSGDPQHLWTPLSVCRYMRDAMIHDKEDALYLAAGIPREWLAEGKRIGVENARTYHGLVGYSIVREKDALVFSLDAPGYAGREVKAMLRLPEAAKIQIQSYEGCEASLNEGVLRVRPNAPKCKIKFKIKKR